MANIISPAHKILQIVLLVSLEKIALAHVPIHVMELCAMKHAIVRRCRVIMSTDAIPSHPSPQVAKHLLYLIFTYIIKTRGMYSYLDDSIEIILFDFLPKHMPFGYLYIHFLNLFVYKANKKLK